MWLSKSLNFSTLHVDVNKPERLNVVWCLVQKKLIFGAFYIPPDISSDINVHDYIVNACDLLQNQYPNTNIALCGDFNSANCEDLCAQLGLFDAVISPTRKNNKLDHILISESLCHVCNSADILPPLMSALETNGVASDHQSVYLPTTEVPKNTNVTYRRVYDYRHSKLTSAINYIAGVNFVNLYMSNDVNVMCDILYDHLYKAISLIPCETVVITTRDKKWMTPLVKSLINRRWKAWRCGNLPLFNHYKWKVRNEIFKAKLSWANKSKNSAKGAWSVVNDIKGKNAGTSLECLLANKNLQELITEITNKFVSNFNENKKPVMLPVPVSSNTTFVIHQREVYNSLIHLKQNKSAGSDGITPRLLVIFANYICAPLCAIFNQSIATCIFPDVWKLAEIIPIPKCAKPTVEQLRPISLLPIMGKVLEKHVADRYRQELVALYGTSQHAYRPNGSCTTALVEMHETVTAMLDEKRTHAVRLIFFDMKAAFDKLRHDFLLERMVQCQLDPSFIAWCDSYLNNRFIRVKLNGEYGPPQACPSSVPQGSVLSPCLFAFFMGSLKLGDQFKPSDYKLIIYADDILLIEKVGDLSAHVSTTDVVRYWCEENDLLINMEKTVQLFIPKRNFSVPDEFDGIPTCSTTCKYLGITFDSSFNLDTHVNYVCTKISQRLYILRTIKRLNLSDKDILIIFNGLILSILRYSAPVLISTNKSSIDKLDRILRRCHRIICDCKVENCIFIVHAAPLIFNCCKNFFQSIKSADHILFNYLPHTLKYTGNYNITFCNTKRRQTSFFPSMALRLNSV